VNARDHLGDDAALYALGALDDAARDAVDEHVATCDACARLLSAAEDDVTVLVAAEVSLDNVVPLRPVRARTQVWRSAVAAAVAAALVIGLVPTTYFWQQDAAMHRTMEMGAAAMIRLESTPHRTVAFNAMPSGAQAHVMYGRDGSWYVVFVHGVTRALSVVWMHDGERTVLGTAQPYGDAALLYLPKSHRMDQLGLMDGSEVVAEAQLAY
jgi:anti-sigma factor RsiW